MLLAASFTPPATSSKAPSSNVSSSRPGCAAAWRAVTRPSSVLPNRPKVSVPAASMSAPSSPSISSVIEVPGPVDSVFLFAPAKSSTVPSAAARLMRTSSASPVAVTSSTPTSVADVAVALSALHRCAVWLCAGLRSVYSARPKSNSCTCSPSACAMPPSMPAKALTPPPPTVSLSTWTLRPLLSTTVSVAFSIAKLPSICRKPKTSRLSWPLTRVSAPCAPSRLSV